MCICMQLLHIWSFWLLVHLLRTYHQHRLWLWKWTPHATTHVQFWNICWRNGDYDDIYWQGSYRYTSNLYVLKISYYVGYIWYGLQCSPMIMPWSTANEFHDVQQGGDGRWTEDNCEHALAGVLVSCWCIQQLEVLDTSGMQQFTLLNELVIKVCLYCV